MDNYITYQELLLILGVLITLYSIVKFIRVYWHAFLERLNGKVEVYESDLLADQQKERFFLSTLEKLINDVRYNILVKAGKTATKEQLLQEIAEQVANYDGLHHPAFRYSLHDYIIQHTENICGVKIEEEELEALWEHLPRKTNP
ncbi:MAG: hypothetical protein EOO20_25055 [Chryseobacterium sp.]|nr:MAG: hypothetical protein EOO20_25055 [Chryseobacterium sp.]